MTFRVLTIREVTPRAEIVEFDEEGLLYPVPSEQRNGIHLEARDGDSVQRVVAHALRVSDEHGRTPRSEGFGVVDDLSIDMLITDARVALACSNFSKGGGWGISIVGAALNTVSYTRAALRCRGKSMVGQIRYPWLTAVHASSVDGRRGSEDVRLEYLAPTGQRHALHIQLPRDIDAPEVAAEITRRAAAYRVATCGTLSFDEINELQRLAGAERLQPQERNWAGRTLPRALPVSLDSARLLPATAPVVAP